MKRIGPFRGIRGSAGIFSPGQEALARKWIRRCYFFGAAAVCLIGLLECVFYFVVQKLGFLIGGPLTYFLKYILAPCALNAAAVAACAAFLRKVRTLWGKACAVSLMYVFVAFVTYTIHIQFPALAMIYALVIFMTVIYGEWRITTITASAALVSKVLSDLFTVWEKKGRLDDLKLAYIGDGNNVANSLIMGCSKVNMDVAIASPHGYSPARSVVERAMQYGNVLITDDVAEAVKGADIVYTDVFISMSEEDDEQKKRKLARYRVTPEVMALAKEDAVFMHCMPVRRGEEVSAEVIDGPRSIVYDQAENRLHLNKAALALLVR